MTARELLERGSQRVATDLSAEPVLRADMRAVLGRLYLRLGLFDSAREHFTDALVLRREQGAPARAVIESFSDFASVRFEDGAFDEAATLLHEAIAIGRRVEGDRGPLVAGAMTDLASAHRAKGEYVEAEALYRQALTTRRATGDPAALATTLNGLGVTLDLGGKPAEAVATLEESIALGRQAHGEGGVTC